MCSFPGAAVTKYRELGEFKQQKFIVSVPEARRLNQGVGRACSLRDLSRNPSLPPPSSAWIASSSGFLGLHCVTPICALVFTRHSPVCLCVHMTFF